MTSESDRHRADVGSGYARGKRNNAMSEFRLTQISDTHLSRAARFASLTENFQRISAHIDAARPDLVINSGDVSWDGPTNRDDLEFAKELHAALPIDCRYLPGNHDVGDNPTAVGAAPLHMANETVRKAWSASPVFQLDKGPIHRQT